MDCKTVDLGGNFSFSPSFFLVLGVFKKYSSGEKWRGGGPSPDSPCILLMALTLSRESMEADIKSSPEASLAKANYCSILLTSAGGSTGFPTEVETWHRQS